MIGQEWETVAKAYQAAKTFLGFATSSRLCWENEC